MNAEQFFEELVNMLSGHEGMDTIPVVVDLPNGTQLTVTDVDFDSGWTTLVIKAV